MHFTLRLPYRYYWLFIPSSPFAAGICSRLGCHRRCFFLQFFFKFLPTNLFIHIFFYSTVIIDINYFFYPYIFLDLLYMMYKHLIFCCTSQKYKVKDSTLLIHMSDV